MLICIMKVIILRQLQKLAVVEAAATLYVISARGVACEPGRICCCRQMCMLGYQDMFLTLLTWSHNIHEDVTDHDSCNFLVPS